MARSGASALMLLAKKHIDLVLMDYDMPVVDEFQVLRMMKADEMFRDIPVMYVTGKGDVNTIIEAFSLGACGYIMKHEAADSVLLKISTYFGQGIYNNAQGGFTCT